MAETTEGSDSTEVNVWIDRPFAPEDNPHKLLEESSFSTLFPQYREKYIRDNWGDIKRILSDHHIKVAISYEDATMTVRTGDKTWDPYIIVKARDVIKLIARGVPVNSAARVLEDGVFCDLIKIGGLVRNKAIFAKRRQRLVGPNGSTLKAVELLSNCYVLVQGQTVATIGSVKGLKSVRRLVEDCMRNVHPVYYIKELMIRRELEKDKSLAKESWDRFLPRFRKRNVNRKTKQVKRKPKKSVFPPQQTPRKEDLTLESGKYFAAEDKHKPRKRDKRA